MKIDFKPKPRREPDLIGLINAVFLLLVFFVVTGTIQTRAPGGIELAGSEDGDLRPAPPDAIAVNAQGDWMIGARNAAPEEITAWIAARDESLPVEVWVDARLEASMFQKRLRETENLAGRTINVITLQARAQ